MPLNDYITLGRSGLRVSPLCLGTMTFGEDWGWGSSVEDSEKILNTYIDRGGNFIDTANLYTKGHSEVVIGDAVGQHSSKRDRLVIATKCTGNMFPEDPNGGGGGRKAIIDGVEHSLRRLKTDYIDLLWAHFLDKHTPIEETLHTMNDLVRSGKVRYIGLSDHPAWVCAKAASIAHYERLAPISAIQIEYSLVERTVEGELLPMAVEHGMGVTPWSPLKGGVLTGKYTRDNRPTEGRATSNSTKNIDERTYGIIDVLLEVAKDTGKTAAQVALNWVQTRPGVTSTIIGARTMDQLETNLGALDFEIPQQHLAALDEASQQKQPFPYDFLEYVRMIIQGRTRVNGMDSAGSPILPEGDADRY